MNSFSPEYSGQLSLKSILSHTYIKRQEISLRPTTHCEILTILIGSQQAAPYDCMNLINVNTA